MSRGGSRTGPWIWSPAVDIGVFLVPTLVALALIGLWRVLGQGPGPLPPWAWLVFVLGIDVAHVWATLLRTYLDPRELRAHLGRYLGIPLTCGLVGSALYAHTPRLFWRILAYLAVTHFVRQQLGWAAIYRARAGTTNRWDRRVDTWAITAATGVPLFLWHTTLPRPFHWLMPGDFLDLAAGRALAPAAHVVLVVALATFVIFHLVQHRLGRCVPVGKLLVVATTAVSWYGGIVVAGDDRSFTLLNVLPHGVPYVALIWSYSRARRRTASSGVSFRLLAGSFFVFVGFLLLCAFGEEMLWDRLIWHDYPAFFGFSPERSLLWLIPWLAVPQASHYVLDGLLWRRRAGGTEQAEALGFGPLLKDLEVPMLSEESCGKARFHC